MERGCLPASSLVDELPLPYVQGPTNYLRDPLSTWERLTLSNTFCESRALSEPRNKTAMDRSQKVIEGHHFPRPMAPGQWGSFADCCYDLF